MKNAKRIISLVLSLLMVFGTTVIAASADDEANFSEIQSWGLNEMANMAENGLTTDLAEDGYKMLNRAPIVASNGYGIYGYLSFANETTVNDKHTYRFVMRYDYSGKNCGTERWMVADIFVDGDTIASNFAGGDMLTDFNSKEYSYDSEYGYAYKETTADVTMTGHDGSAGEFRIYTRGFWDFRIYKYFVYDITVDPEMQNPIFTVNAESFQNLNDEDGKRDPAGFYENSSYTIDRGFRVLKGQAVAGAYNNKTALANTREYAAGNYAFNATISADTIDEGTICTAAVKNSAGEIVASKEISKADLTKTNDEKIAFFNGRTTVEVPFTVTEAGNYTVAILVNDKANVTIQSMSISVEIDETLIIDAENKIDAIGEVTYPDSKDVMDAATAAVQAVIEAYGSNATAYISNFTVYEDAIAIWTGFVEREEAKIAAGQAIAELIDNLDVENPDAELMVNIAEAIEQFATEYPEVNEYTVEEMKKYIPNIEKFIGLLLVPGDVDGDGKVTTGDALMALQAAVGKIELNEAQIVLANVDNEGGVTTADALMILQAAVGKITLSWDTPV